jgi:hypothetical protein
VTPTGVRTFYFVYRDRDLNAEGMIRDGWTEEEIAPLIAQWRAEGPQWHAEVMAHARRFISDPHAPSCKLQ